MKEERIDNYVMGKMTADECLSFEQEMAADVALQKEVALHRDVVRAIRMKAAKEHLQKVERQIRTEERRRKVFTIRIAAAALAASVFHFGQIPIPTLKQTLKDNDIIVRL